MMYDPIEQTCATCVWWERSGARLANAERDPSCSGSTGTCQVRGPQVVGGRFDNFPYTVFPQTHESRFCGEWEGMVPPGGDGDGGERVIAFPTANRIAA